MDQANLKRNKQLPGKNANELSSKDRVEIIAKFLGNGLNRSHRVGRGYIVIHSETNGYLACIRGIGESGVWLDFNVNTAGDITWSRDLTGGGVITDDAPNAEIAKLDSVLTELPP